MGKASFRRQRRGLRPSLSRGPKRPRYGAKKQRVIGTQMRGTSTRGTIIRRKSLEDDKCIKAIEVLKDINKAAKLFRLNRKVDDTGVSGTGIVAEGVKFSDGKVAIRWTSEHKSTTVFDSMKDLKKVHGHNGKTKVEFMSKSQETKPTAHIYNPKDFGRLEPSSATKSFNVPFETPKWIYPEAQLKKPSFPIFKSYDSSTPKYDYHQMRSSLLGKKAEEHAKDLSTAIRSKDKEAAKLHASSFIHFSMTNIQRMCHLKRIFWVKCPVLRINIGAKSLNS